MDDRLFLTEGVERLLLQYCLVHSGAEVCGIIAAHRESPRIGRRLVMLRNVAVEPWHRFAFYPDEQVAAYRQFARCDEEPMAVFHSHPKSPPFPSDHDLNGAVDLGPAHIIVSLQGMTPVVRAYRYSQPFIGVKEFAPITLDTYVPEGDS